MSEEQEGEKPYIVTRGKPPREHMFKPGQSGNPKGRPPGSKNHRTEFLEEIDELIEVNVRGKRRKITKWRASCRQQANKAAKGDNKSFNTCANLRDRYAPPETIEHSAPEDLTAADLAALEALRQLWGAPATPAGPVPAAEVPLTAAASFADSEPSCEAGGDPDNEAPEADGATTTTSSAEMPVTVEEAWTGAESDHDQGDGCDPPGHGQGAAAPTPSAETPATLGDSWPYARSDHDDSGSYDPTEQALAEAASAPSDETPAYIGDPWPSPEPDRDDGGGYDDLCDDHGADEAPPSNSDWCGDWDRTL